jgi:hypothetical protein
LAVLGLVVGVVLALVAPVAGVLDGVSGVAAAAVAAALCLAGAGVALPASRVASGPNGALVGVLLGTAARMAIPLGGGFVLQIRAEPLAEAGLLYYLLAFYPVTLALETWVSLPRTQAASRSNQAGFGESGAPSGESGASLGKKV